MSVYTNQQQAVLMEMGIQVWRARQGEHAQQDSHQTDVVQTPEVNAVSALDWNELRERVATCEKCALHKSRTQTVFGVGSHSADILFVGEAPGAREDQLGEPFVGRAGKLLDNMLEAIGLHRAEIYIANILKCRPPNNRDPVAEEVAICTDYLDRQVALLQPKVIVALGRIAAHYLLNTDTPLSRLRGRQWQYRDSHVPLIVTYHPAYLLRSPRDKSKSYQDLLTIQKLTQ